MRSVESMTDTHPAVGRIVREHDGAGLLDALGERLSTADLTTLLLEVMRRRVAALTPARVLAQYERDRFVRPAVLDPRRLIELELLALDAIGPQFVQIAISPLVPLGTHAVLAGVHQNRLVTTVRSSEVAADPTSALALEAAARRRHVLASSPRSGLAVHLAAVQRVVRAQRFDGPRSFAHFDLLGLASAGRDTGSRSFERAALRQHLRALVSVCERAGFPRVRIRLTDLGGDDGDVLEEVGRDLAGDGVTVVAWPERTAARGYYPGVCFKLDVLHGAEQVELADGGLVGWTQPLVGSAKERLMTSGLSLERLAVIASEDRSARRGAGDASDGSAPRSAATEPQDDRRDDHRADDRTDDPARPEGEAIAAQQADQQATDERADEAGDEGEAHVDLPRAASPEQELGDPSAEEADEDDSEDEHDDLSRAGGGLDGPNHGAATGRSDGSSAIVD